MKETEIGPIPIDWQLINLKSLGKFRKGKNIPKSAISQEGVPCILYGEIYTRYREHGTKLISKIPQEYSKNSTQIQKGDVLFAGSGETAEEIGKCFAYCGDENGFAGGDVIIFTPHNVDSLYLGYLLNSHAVVKQKSLMGQGSSVFHIYPSSLEKIKIPLPPTKAEQTAIATALSDADALITSLERLIAKKKAIKQGAMQELLRPKTDWQTKNLGEIANIATGSTPSTSNKSNYGGEFMFVTPTDLGRSRLILNTERTLSATGFAQARKFPAKSILFTCIGSTIGKSGIALEQLTANQQINAILPNDSYDCDYLYYILDSLSEKIKQGAGETAVPIINKSDFGKINIPLPFSKAEQTRIAQILSDMDAEIALLEQKLEKQRLIKQGMMQVLLTGKVRLL